jgi:hypothetical protein
VIRREEEFLTDGKKHGWVEGMKKRFSRTEGITDGKKGTWRKLGELKKGYIFRENDVVVWCVCCGGKQTVNED